MIRYSHFIYRTFRPGFMGGTKFYLWMGLLSIISLMGLHAYTKQFADGLALTGMTDQVSWGVYIANFTFIVMAVNISMLFTSSMML